MTQKQRQWYEMALLRLIQTMDDQDYSDTQLHIMATQDMQAMERIISAHAIDNLEKEVD